MAIDVLLVDDEPLARERLKRLLVEHKDFHLAGEAAHGEAALDWLRLNRVQLVLLDIQMPGKTGLEVAAAIQELPKPPQVIFCTAYDEHALAAFRVKALDYLSFCQRSSSSRAIKKAGPRNQRPAFFNMRRPTARGLLHLYTRATPCTCPAHGESAP